jgi:hypothetical protein
VVGGFFFHIMKSFTINDGIHRCIILSKWMRFFFVTSLILFFHIISHILGKSKPSNVYVNQQANIGPKLLCLLHSFKNLYFCLHKYSFTFLFDICNYCVTSLSYHGFHTIINYGQSELAPTNALTWMDGALTGFFFLSMCHFRSTFFFCAFF